MKGKQMVKAVFSSDRRLLALCCVVFFLCSVLFSMGLWAQEQIVRAMGRLSEQTLAFSDFELSDLAEDGKVLTSQSVDPRMVVKEPPQYVYQVTVYGEFIGQDPGEFCVFYKTSPNQEEFDANYRVWAKDNSDGSYTFEMPHTKIYGLRIDPGIYTGVQLSVESIVINSPRSLAAYLTPSISWLLAQAVVPLIAAALIKVLMEAWPVLCSVGRKLVKK